VEVFGAVCEQAVTTRIDCSAIPPPVYHSDTHVPPLCESTIQIDKMAIELFRTVLAIFKKMVCAKEHS